MTNLYETDVCKHCGKPKGKHQSNTWNCPIKVSYARNFAGFVPNQHFEPKLTKKKPKEPGFTI